jgi:hypothetical protein
MKKFLLALSLATLFFACSNSGEEEISEGGDDTGVVEERVLFPESTDTVFNELRSEQQSFSVSMKQHNSVTGANGVVVDIAPGVFVDANGNEVENVEVELLEALDIQSFIGNNLQTVSDGALLQSSGMFYVNATANGEPVSLKDGNALTVQIPTNMVNGDMQVFYGNYDDNGTLNWTPVGGKTMAIDFNMSAVPLELLDYEGMSEEFLVRGNPEVKSEILALNDPKYEGTFIATTEFKARLQIHVLGAITNKDKAVFGQVMDIYKEHLDDNLYEADSLVAVFLTPHYNELMKKLRSQDEEENSSESALKFAKAFVDLGESLWQNLTSFKNARLTRPMNFEKLGITDSTSRDELIKKGYTPADADRMLVLYRQNGKVIEGLKNQVDADEKQEELQNYTVSVTKMGWVNIDRFLNDPLCAESDFKVNVLGADESMAVKLTLIFPIRNICVQAIYNEGNLYSFTQKNGDLRKLPIGEEVYVVGLASKAEETFFGLTKFKIPTEGEFELSLEPATMDEIKSAMDEQIEAKSI